VRCPGGRASVSVVPGAATYRMSRWHSTLLCCVWRSISSLLASLPIATRRTAMPSHPLENATRCSRCFRFPAVFVSSRRATERVYFFFFLLFFAFLLFIPFYFSRISHFRHFRSLLFPSPLSNFSCLLCVLCCAEL
jgi:hypothetical protein